MRRACVTLAALALAACKVDVEGARCEVPGSAAECPDGQACGNDLRCSTRAAACLPVLCTPGATPAVSPKRCSSGLSAIETCTGADPICGAWAALAGPGEDCAASSLVCDPLSSVPACVCRTPASGEAIAVDVAAPTSALARTGAADPHQCRFRRLGDALAAAAARAAADAFATPVVKAIGGSSGATVSFGSAVNLEALPLVVSDRVTLTSDSATSGAKYEIVLDDGNAASAVNLSSRSTFSRFSVRNVAGDSTKRAVKLQCDDVKPDPVNLDAVTISANGADAAHTLEYGLVVDTLDTCGIVASSVDISGAAGDCLHVDAKIGTVASSFTGGSVKGCTRGVYLRKGALAVTGTRIELNGGSGIRAGEANGDSALELADAFLVENGDTGLVVLNNRRLVILGTTIYGNAAVTNWTSASGSRHVGGVVLWGNPPVNGADFQFHGNRVYANKGDQVLALSSGITTWNIDGTACGTDPVTGRPANNVFACYDTQTAVPSYRGVVALDSRVAALYASWQNGVPTLTTDFSEIGASASVDATGSGLQYCGAATVSCGTRP